MNFTTLYSSLSTQTLVLGGITLMVFAAGIKFGKSKIVAGLLSLYITSFIYLQLFIPKVAKALPQGKHGVLWNYVGSYVICFGIIAFLLNKVILADFGEAPLKFLKALLCAVLFTGLLVSISLHLIPLLPTIQFTPFIQTLFVSQNAFTAWLVAPLILLFL